MYIVDFILCITIFLGLFTGCIWIIYSFKTRSERELVLTKNFSNQSYEDFFKYIDFLMDMELYFTVELILKGNYTGRVTDFESLLHDMTSNTQNGLSGLTIKKAINIGINEEYIYEYITRGCTIRLLNYMKENNTGIVKQEENEEEG